MEFGNKSSRNKFGAPTTKKQIICQDQLIQWPKEPAEKKS